MHVRNTNRYHRPAEETEAEFTRFLLDDLEESIVQAGPETVAMVIFEPVQNAGGSFTPPAGYFQGVREICDRYGILLCADEVITGFGRTGAWFASERYDIKPDLITCAKGLSSSYAAIGAVLIADKVAERVRRARRRCTRTASPSAGIPVGCAIALKNLEIMQREQDRRARRGDAGRLPRAARDAARPRHRRRRARHRLPLRARAREGQGDARDVQRRRVETLLRGFLSPALFEHGLICRADDRGDPVVQISPPLSPGRRSSAQIVGILGDVLTEAWKRIS